MSKETDIEPVLTGQNLKANISSVLRGYDLKARDMYDIHHTRVFRDSRKAFGVRFEVEKPSRDWPWFVAALIASACAVAVMLAKVAA